MKIRHWSTELVEGDQSLCVTVDGVVVVRHMHMSWDTFGHLDALINNTDVKDKDNNKSGRSRIVITHNPTSNKKNSPTTV